MNSFEWHYYPEYFLDKKIIFIFCLAARILNTDLDLKLIKMSRDARSKKKPFEYFWRPRNSFCPKQRFKMIVKQGKGRKWISINDSPVTMDLRLILENKDWTYLRYVFVKKSSWSREDEWRSIVFFDHQFIEVWVNAWSNIIYSLSDSVVFPITHGI